VNDWNACSSTNLRYAAEISTRNDLRFDLLNVGDLSRAQSIGDLRLQYVVCSGGAATYVAFRYFSHYKPHSPQK